MSYSVTNRWGAEKGELSLEEMREVLASLDIEDEEHPDVSLTHESGWSLSAFPSGLLIWENTEADTDAPRHRRGIPREEVLRLWIALSQGRIEEVEAEPWLPGYGQ